MRRAQRPPGAAAAAAPRRPRACVRRGGARAPQAPRAAPGDPLPPSPSSSYPDLGPAAAAALDSLEWRSLCASVARFASTAAGAAAAAAHPLGATLPDSVALARQTDAARFVECDLGRPLDFGGIDTGAGASAADRAARGAVLAGSDLAAVASLASGSVRLAAAVRAAERAAGPAAERVAPLVAAVARVDADALKTLSRALDDAVAPDGVLKDGASPGLRQARARARDAAARARAAVGGGGDPAERRGRLCLAVGPGDAPPKGAVLLATGSGGVCYFEPPAAVAANNALAAARGEADAADASARAGLSAVVGEAAAAVAEGADAVVAVDLAAARARYGVWISGSLARFVPLAPPPGKGGRARGGSKGGKGGDAGDSATSPSSSPSSSPDAAFVESYCSDAPLVELRSLRQPLLLARHLAGRDSAARRRAARGPGAALKTPIPPPPIPVDVVIERGTRVVVVTGPNAGGKTASLKAVGLAALAARAGVPLPASSLRSGPPRVPWFDAVLADVGDGQGLAAGLSTFSGHLARVGALRKESSPSSLVLLDELGTGTDPDEGAALGAALLTALAGGEPADAGVLAARATLPPRGVAALSLATTHAASLARLKARDARFENVAAEVDPATLAPTHRLLWGVPGASCGLAAAERLGLDPAVVAAARSLLGAAGPSLDGLAGALAAARTAAAADRVAATAAAAAAAADRAAAAAARSRAAAAEASAVLAVATSTAAAVAAGRAELAARERSRRAKDAARGRAEAAAEAAAAEAAAAAVAAAAAAAKPISVGDTVFLPRLRARAVVASVARGGKLTLRLGGGMTTKASADDVVREG